MPQGAVTRLREFRAIDLPAAQAIFRRFDPAIAVLELVPMRGGMSTSNYAARTDRGTFLLKLYSGGCGVEPAMYARLSGVVPTPILHYAGDDCAILEFIEGEALFSYIPRLGKYPLDLAQEAGALLARIHTISYEAPGLLDASLRVVAPDHGAREKLLARASGRAGSHLRARTRARIAEFCLEHAGAFDRIGASRVLCHGDYNYGNILVKGGHLFLIDFEYASAGSAYRDIGKFFRRKSDPLQRMIREDVYAAFAEGYGNLQEDWLSLARVADMPAMLALNDADSPPNEWVSDIERDILFAIDS
jgi:Ser/Thr protein kinase RdoA (MazF antagonist)